MESNKTYAGGDDEDDTKRFQETCLIISPDSDLYSEICNNLNNITLLGTENYPRTTTDTYDVLSCYKKPTTQHQVHAPPAEVTLTKSGDIEKNKKIPGKYEM